MDPEKTLNGLVTKADLISYATGTAWKSTRNVTAVPVAEVAKAAGVDKSPPDWSVTLTQDAAAVDKKYPDNELLHIVIGTTLIDAIKSISGFVPEIRLDFSNEGISMMHFQNPPRAHIIMFVSARDMGNYRVKDGHVIAFNVKSDVFYAKIKNCGGNILKMFKGKELNAYITKDGQTEEVNLLPPTELHPSHALLPKIEEFHTVLVEKADNIKPVFPPASTKQDIWSGLTFTLGEGKLQMRATKRTGDSYRTFENQVKPGSTYNFIQFNDKAELRAKVCLDGMLNIIKLMGNRKQLRFGVSNRDLVFLEAEYTMLSNIRVYIPYSELTDTGKSGGEASAAAASEPDMADSESYDIEEV